MSRALLNRFLEFVWYIVNCDVNLEELLEDA